MEEKVINKTNIRFNIMVILLIIIFCIAISPVSLQNDTFYTIKIGEHIVNNGIDMKDPFSFHENLEYTYPHWAYDVGIYYIYQIGGQVGIYISTVVLCSILGILIYVLNSKLTKNNIISFIITIGSIYMLNDFIAARAQLVTFILFLLTVYFIEKFLETAKKRYAIGLIIIPIIIANVHVAVFPFYFILYLPYIGEYMIYILSQSGIVVNNSKIIKLKKKLETANEEEAKDINEKIQELEERIKTLEARHEKADKNAYKIKIDVSKNIKYLIIIMIICLFTGLLTPLGDTPYTYLIKTMQGNTTSNINEHLPLTLINNPRLMGVLVVFIAILMFTDTKIKLHDLFMLAGLLLLTFYSKRQQTMFILMGGMILNKLVSAMFEKYDALAPEKIKKKMTQYTGMVVTISLVLSLSINIFKPKMDDDFINKRNYPVDAAEYIRNNLDIKNIRLYNEYNYGSYLLFKDIPVFIDSRADLYSPEFNEGVNVFNDFLDISGVNNDKVEETLDKYGITHLIMYSNSKLRTFIKQNEEKYTLLYEDDDRNFCVYERKQIASGGMKHENNMQ